MHFGDLKLSYNKECYKGICVYQMYHPTALWLHFLSMLLSKLKTVHSSLTEKVSWFLFLI